MCTVTFIARRSGYCLGMNRDEKLTRASGLPPTKKKLNGRVVLCPSEPGGGTWIALNDSGACLALINWYSVNRNVTHNAISRGEIVKTTCAADSWGVVDTKLKGLPLDRISPFRLIGIFPGIKVIVEWRWDSSRLVAKRRPWQAQQWISSGFDESAAQRVRGRIFRTALRERPGAGRLDWLRRLHRSHSPRLGPFSTCMHRSDAATVSYTEVAVSRRIANMRYEQGAPCRFLRPLKQSRFSTGIAETGMNHNFLSLKKRFEEEEHVDSFR
jgi:hypothetical protein